ncbi:TIGR04283 family arsenosugar biosynthesis glycosyltransferase [Roseovarius sp. SCSIO 43702]|uniref:TIGR04283 family arsenosugar biosynthesis glycosyltransferase n=1 Tax=Roseovarius sp. SCSIO 43702 TaxID=2823043 RepID=UPI001C72A20E|nr:TIGR04283 family arsenosugar biosynthesis glycosyltransferase [Roseovarius sp. SCSIO 43702]QYX56756.1 TIGR04283 family arsenosugar biosynthesis glycosyltransferase [Roseovarius sp. SCSIO 43702]
MQAGISVVIPTLDAGDALPGCLAALSEGVEAGLVRELVISDGGSGDATRDIAGTTGAILVTGPASRGGQMRRGAASASGDWLLFLHADTRLSPGWSEAVKARLGDGRPGWFRLRFDEASPAARLVAGWANLRARLFRLPYGDQGLLISRRDYDVAGGYEDIPLMEDVALARKLGRRLRPLDATATTSAERYRREGWLRRGARNLSLLLCYLAGADPRDLRDRY